MAEVIDEVQKLEQRISKLQHMLNDAKRKKSMLNFKKMQKLLKENNVTWDEVENFVISQKKVLNENK